MTDDNQSWEELQAILVWEGEGGAVIGEEAYDGLSGGVSDLSGPC